MVAFGSICGHDEAMNTASAKLNAPQRLPMRAAERERFEVDALVTALHDDLCELRGARGERIALPPTVFALLRTVVDILAAGDAVTIVPVGRELTTQRAADILNVSRQYLVRLLDDGRIPYTRTGSHRRVKIEDVLAFKEQRDRERIERLDDLTRLHEDLGGYDD
jgi:excisionase family DNA binding protein